MKRLVVCVLTVLSVSIMFNSCSKDQVSFDESLLYGTWEQIDGADTYYYKYISGGTGKYWFNAEPVELARDITWKLVNADLTITHKSNDGTWGSPEYYTVTSLTSTTLKFKDDFGGEFTQTKISK